MTKASVVGSTSALIVVLTRLSSTVSPLFYFWVVLYIVTNMFGLYYVAFMICAMMALLTILIPDLSIGTRTMQGVLWLGAASISIYFMWKDL